ncbi:alpha/beta hydrolase [Tenacibaculum sp. nBUS_03]|uniref:alpha/beta hydrolase n=1 Tax=Tenacibaculum sp. nBUS_03 TaxID=3395320 RepID=UPI003EB84DFD
MKVKLVVLLFVFKSVFSFGQANLAGSYGLDPVVQNFLEVIHAYQGPPIQELPLNIARQAMEDLQKEEFVNKDVVINHRSIPYLNRKLELKIIKPKKRRRRKLPVVVYFHGGGWILNSFSTHKRLLSDIALKAEVAVVFVQYSRSPEVKYPVANKEGYATLLWLKNEGKKNRLDSSRIIVCGDSVGGNMATAVAMMSKNNKGPNLLAQVLLYPVTNANFNTQSYEKFSKGHYLSREAMVWFWDSYAPQMKLRNLATVSPLKATKEDLKGLPKTLLITAENDVLRDEGESYAKKLREAKVPVISTRYGGTIHDFIVLNALKETEASKAALSQICSFLKNTFLEKK